MLSRLRNNTEQLTAVRLSCQSRNTYFPLSYQIIICGSLMNPQLEALYVYVKFLWKKLPFLPLYPHLCKNPSVIFHLLCKDIRNWIPPPRMRNVIKENHRYKLFGCYTMDGRGNIFGGITKMGAPSQIFS